MTQLPDAYLLLDADGSSGSRPRRGTRVARATLDRDYALGWAVLNRGLVVAVPVIFDGRPEATE